MELTTGLLVLFLAHRQGNQRGTIQRPPEAARLPPNRKRENKMRPLGS